MGPAVDDELDGPAGRLSPPGAENLCPEGQAAFQDYAGEFNEQFGPTDGPMGLRR